MKLRISHVFLFLLAMIGISFLPIVNAGLVCDEFYQYRTTNESGFTEKVYEPSVYLEIHSTFSVKEARWGEYYGSYCQYVRYGSWYLYSYWITDTHEVRTAGLYGRLGWPKDFVGLSASEDPYMWGEAAGKQHWYDSYDYIRVLIYWSVDTQEYHILHFINGEEVYQ